MFTQQTEGRYDASGKRIDREQRPRPVEKEFVQLKANKAVAQVSSKKKVDNFKATVSPNVLEYEVQCTSINACMHVLYMYTLCDSHVTIM